MNQIIKKSTAVATVSDYRLPLWPVSKSHTTALKEGKWGAFKVERGGVTARHRDIVDVILCLAIDIEYVRSSITNEVEMHILYDAKEVLKMLNTKSNFAWLQGLILDMQSTVISIRKKNGDWPDSWALVSFSGDSKKDKSTYKHQFSGKLKKLVLSPGAFKWMETDIQVFIKKNVMTKIMALKNQVSRSVAKWFLSHSNAQNHNIQNVLASVGCEGGERMINKRINQLIEDAEGLKKLGIIVGESVRSIKIEGVWFENPKAEIELN